MSVRWSFYTYLFFPFFHLFSILFSVSFLFPSSSFSSVLFHRRCSSFFRTPSILYLWILSFFYHLLQFDLIYHPLIFFFFFIILSLYLFLIIFFYLFYLCHAFLSCTVPIFICFINPMITFPIILVHLSFLIALSFSNF